MQVSSGGNYGADQWSTIALLDDGSVWTWGANGNGQLGTRTGAGTDATCAGGLPCSATPAQVSGLPAR